MSTLTTPNPGVSSGGAAVSGGAGVPPAISPAPGTLTITINGKAIQARPGQTILRAAAAAGIDIPTLCDLPSLPSHGSCRICLVEIEKQRALQPACTFPVAEGLVVQTETEKVIAARKMNLQLIFSERQHYCMFCAMSGSAEKTDCELQRLAYRYGLDHWTYPPDTARQWPIDASRKHFLVDHGRCILCRRCIRACDVLAANHTLGVTHRGARTMVSADDDVPFGKSSCVSCGTCLQVCPTGALIDRRSAFGGHAADVTRTPATCLGCAVGCGIRGVVRDNQLLRIEADENDGAGGLLCESGRFDALANGHDRILRPLIRTPEGVRPATWDQALGAVAQQMRSASRVAGLLSPRITNESLVAFGCFFNEVLKSDELALLRGHVPPLDLGASATLADLPKADCIAIVGGDPLREQKVVGYLVRRALDRGARLLIVNDAPTTLDNRAHLRLRLDVVARAGAPFALLGVTYHLRLDSLLRLRESIEKAERPVVLYGNEMSTAVHAALRAFPAKTRFLPLVDGANTMGAARLGISARAVQGEVLYVLAGDDLPDPTTPLPRALFTVVQAAYPSAWTEQADVVLPARTWPEHKGRVVNLEGRERNVVPLIKPPAQVHADWAVLMMLAAVLGRPLLLNQAPEIAASL